MHVPFYVYSTKQAIEEGFILDVLVNYITYDTKWRLRNAAIEQAESALANPEVDERKAKAKLVRSPNRTPRRWRRSEADRRGLPGQHGGAARRAGEGHGGDHRAAARLRLVPGDPLVGPRAARLRLRRARGVLVSSMLAKDPGARPTAAAVNEALLTLTTTGPGPDRSRATAKTTSDRDPTRPFRWPLLAPAPARAPGPEARASSPTPKPGCCKTAPARWIATARPRRSACWRTASSVPATTGPCSSGCVTCSARRSLRREYTRAAAVLDAAGRDYRQYFPPDDPDVLDCAYHAGHAYAEIGKPGKALSQPRIYAQNADTAGDRRRGAQDPGDSLRHRAPAGRRRLPRRGAR